jgi:putative transposase
MPRKPRIHVPGAYHHVTLRGNHRQDIFFCDAHRQWLDDIVAKTMERCGSRVHAYCWMTNHAHLLVQTGDVPLGRIILRIAGQYARRVQSHLSTTGHLFECRYHAKLVDADQYLLTLLRYIHGNPISAKMVTALDDYPWSSHHAYVGKVNQPWVTTSVALGLLHTDPNHARAMYQRLMNDEVANPTPLPIDQLNPNDPRVLGDDDFLAHVLGMSWRPRLGRTLAQVIDEACVLFGVTVEALESRSPSRLHAQARAWVANQCVVHRVASVAEVARRFGRDESTVRESMLRYYSRTAT